MGLHMLHDLGQVLHVGSVILARHDHLVVRQLIPSAGGHQPLAVTHVDVLQAFHHGFIVMTQCMLFVSTSHW